MANQTGTASSQEDLIGQLFTFAAANGFTNEELDNVNNHGTLSRTTDGAELFVHFQWDGTEVGGPNAIAMYQSLGFSGASTDPWNHTNDSGNGVDDSLLDDERRVSGIGNGPFTGYHFFADTTPAPHCYVVLQYASGFYRHFGFGILEKIGDWTGGEFVYGHVWFDNLDLLQGTAHSILLDGLHADSSPTDTRHNPATIHAEGLTGQPGSPGRWLNVGNGATTWNQGLDGDGEARGQCVGGARAATWNTMFGRAIPSLINGFIPLIPIPATYTIKATPDDAMLLGFMPNVRHISMKNFSPAQALTVGSDTWTVFPGVRKRYEQDDQEESGNMGFAYLTTA